MHAHTTSLSRRVAAIAAFTVTASLALTGSAAASHFGSKQFQSPSHNIGCVMVKAPANQGGGEARCDIAEHSWTAPPKPHSCELDWGFGVVVGNHHKGDYVCAGDTALHQGPVLDYGDSIKFGGFKCKSNVQSMRCHNKQTGHGFSLSREQAKLF
jgi:hypothetical protein